MGAVAPHTHCIDVDVDADVKKASYLGGRGLLGLAPAPKTASPPPENICIKFAGEKIFSSAGCPVTLTLSFSVREYLL